jgi:hypothetical protein
LISVQIFAGNQKIKREELFSPAAAWAYGPRPSLHRHRCDRPRRGLSSLRSTAARVTLGAICLSIATLRIDTRWAAGDTARIRGLAAEMVTLGPDVIFTSGFSTIRPLLDATSAS